MQEPHQNVETRYGNGHSTLEARKSALEPRKSAVETRRSGSRNSLGNTIKRLLRPIPKRKSIRPQDPSKEGQPADQQQAVIVEDDSQTKDKNPDLKTATFAITFSCECATRRAVEVDGVSVGEELSSMISREIVEKRKSKSMIWPTVKILGNVRRQSSAGKLQAAGNHQTVVVQTEASYPSTRAKKWVVDTINKISGSLHCQKSVPPS